MLLPIRQALTWRNRNPYLVNDGFDTDVAAGSLNGSQVLPGPGGTRFVTDTNGKMSVGSGTLTVVTGGATSGDPGGWYSVYRRVPGLFILGSITYTSAIGFQIGFDTDMAGAARYSINGSGTSLRVTPNAGGTQITVGAIAATNTYQLCMAMRHQGFFALIKGGAFSNWTLVWIDTTEATGPLYPNISANSSTNAWSGDNVKVPNAFWLPTPLASDGFGGSFGTTDGMAHAEGVSGWYGTGGNGLTWTQVGTWGNSGGVASASALSGGVAYATVPCGTANVIARLTPTRNGGSAGLLLRYVDASNHVRVYIDGTNAKVDDVTAGTPTNRISAAATQNAQITVDLSGANARLYVGNTLVGTSGAIANTTGTAHGLYTTDTGNTFDDFHVYAKGTGGEYSILDNY